MSDQMVRKVICDYGGCPSVLVDVDEDEATGQLDLPEDWHQLTRVGDIRLHFCSLECLAQWAASKVGRSLTPFSLDPGAFAAQVAAGGPGPMAGVAAAGGGVPSLRLRPYWLTEGYPEGKS